MPTTDTQSAVLSRIEELLAADDLILVIDRQYANTGTVYATGRSLDAVGERLSYTFQRGSVNFNYATGGQPAVWFSKTGTAPFVAQSLDELVERVAILLAGGVA